MVEFERKYSHLTVISDKWYKKELKIESMQSFDIPVRDDAGEYNEEWYRARLMYGLVMSETIPSGVIGLELRFKKGSVGSTNIEPDVVIFKNSNWFKQYINYVNDNRDRAIFGNILMVGEGKKNTDTKGMVSAAYNQIFPVMQMAQRKKNEEPIVFGFYFDSKHDILLFKLKGLRSLERYFDISSDDLFSMRDSVNSFPTYDVMSNLVTGEKKIPEKDPSKLHYEELEAISDETFNDLITLLKQKALTTGIQGISDTQQRLITESVSLKMYDEECLRIGVYPTTKFYYLENETLRTFRDRFQAELINAARLAGQSTTQYSDNDYKFIKEIVRAFQYFNLSGAHGTSFNQAVFNNFGDNNIKSDLNQWFTPIPMMKSIVGMVNPKPNEIVYDPTGGIFDFLTMSFLNAFGKSMVDQAEHRLYGSEINPETANLGKLNLSINGDTKATNIFCMDSANSKLLDLSGLSDDDKGKVNRIQKFIPFNSETGEGFTFSEDDTTWVYHHPQIVNPIPVFQADVIETNPPFGEGQAYSKDEIPVELYSLASGGSEETTKNKIDKGIIFLENTYRCLKPGGKMAIVLSNSLMSKNETIYVREWLLTKVRIVAVIDFPQKSFADVDIATTVIIAYKPKDELERNLYLSEGADYEYFSKKIEEDMIGYTKSDSKKKKAKKFNPVFMVSQAFEHINLNFINPSEIVSKEELRFVFTNLKYQEPEIQEKIRLYEGKNRKEFFSKNFELKNEETGAKFVIHEKITSMVKEFKYWLIELKVKEPAIYNKFLTHNGAMWFGKLYQEYMD